MYVSRSWHAGHPDYLGRQATAIPWLITIWVIIHITFILVYWHKCTFIASLKDVPESDRLSAVVRFRSEEHALPIPVHTLWIPYCQVVSTSTWPNHLKWSVSAKSSLSSSSQAPAAPATPATPNTSVNQVKFDLFILDILCSSELRLSRVRF